jgi:hypothetical protein
MFEEKLLPNRRLLWPMMVWAFCTLKYAAWKLWSKLQTVSQMFKVHIYKIL